jgi:hypothetical protein
VTAALDEVTAMLRQVTGEDAGWASAVSATSRLDGDLRLESVEVVALGELMRAAHGGTDLLGHLAGLDLDDLIALTVGDLADLVERSR